MLSLNKQSKITLINCTSDNNISASIWLNGSIQRKYEENWACASIMHMHIVHTRLLIFWNLHGVCLINYLVPNSWCKYIARCSPHIQTWIFKAESTVWVLVTVQVSNTYWNLIVTPHVKILSSETERKQSAFGTQEFHFCNNTAVWHKSSVYI